MSTLSPACTPSWVTWVAHGLHLLVFSVRCVTGTMLADQRKAQTFAAQLNCSQSNALA
jgi:hypothetical protein